MAVSVVEIIQLGVMFILIQHKAVPLQNVLSCTLLSHLRVCASARSHMAFGAVNLVRV